MTWSRARLPSFTGETPMSHDDHAAAAAAAATVAASADGPPPPRRNRRPLAPLAPDAYRHPLDLQATAALRAVPGFERAVGAVSRRSIEHLLYVEACANAVRVTPRQCGRIHGLLRDACATLGVAPEPALFLAQTPIANAFAVGRESPCIVLQTGLIELLDEEELRAILGHELGHIHCGHSVYRLMALLMTLVLGRFPGAMMGLGDLFTLGLQVALLEWSRKAEFSADRAAVLCVQDDGGTLFRALFKLTGGTPKVFDEMDADEYLRQADEYDGNGSAALDKVYKLLLSVPQTHPIPVLRAREALRWGGSDTYRAILAGESAGSAAPDRPAGGRETGLVTCGRCGQATDGAFSFCTHCGADRPAAATAAKEIP
jgi:Zn-dependent protease with chaperone function